MNCEHCGGTLSLDDMTRPNCPFCKNVLKHHARAAEHAVLVNKMLDQRIGAQYPGLPADKRPQIGHSFGAPMDPSFQAFQQHQTAQAFSNARKWIIIGVVVPLVISVLVAAVVVVLMVVVSSLSRPTNPHQERSA